MNIVVRTLLATVATVSIGFTASAQQAIDVDFCGSLEFLSVSTPIQSVDAVFDPLLDAINAEDPDLNGNLIIDFSTVTPSINITGNGITDGANELKLLETILGDPDGFPTGTSVLSNLEVSTAYAANLAQLLSDLGNAGATALENAIPGTAQLVAAYLTLGDGDATILSTEPFRLQASGSIGAAYAILALAEAGLQATAQGSIAAQIFALNPFDYTAVFGLQPGGDADGDGASNKCEAQFTLPGFCNPLITEGEGALEGTLEGGAEGEGAGVSCVVQLDGTQAGTGSTATGTASITVNLESGSAVVDVVHDVPSPASISVRLSADDSLLLDLGNPASPVMTVIGGQDLIDLATALSAPGAGYIEIAGTDPNDTIRGSIDCQGQAEGEAPIVCNIPLDGTQAGTPSAATGTAVAEADVTNQIVDLTVTHDVPSPVSAAIRLVADDSLVADLGDPTSPIEETFTGAGFAALASSLGQPGSGYIEIVGTDPNDTIRGVIDCSGATEGEGEGTPPVETGRVRALHAIPDAGPVTLCVDGFVGGSVSFGELTAYGALPVATYALKAVAEGDACTDPGLVELSQDVAANTDYTFIVAGTAGSPQTLTLTDDNTPAPFGSTKVRIVHLSPDAPEIDVVALGTPNSTVFDDIEFLEVGGYLTVNPGNYDLEVRTSDGVTGILSLPNVQLRERGVYTIFAVNLAANLQVLLQQDVAGEDPSLQELYPVAALNPALFPQFVFCEEQVGELGCEFSLDESQVVSPTGSAATGTATITQISSSLARLVVTHNVADATDATIYTGKAGEEGGALLTLSANGATRFSSLLTIAQVEDYATNGAYIEIASDAFPFGEIRGQVVCPRYDNSVDVEGEGEGVIEGGNEGEGEGVIEGGNEGEGEGVIEGGNEGEGDPCAETGVHSADAGNNGANNRIELQELLRVIQFFNSTRFGCVISPATSVDGYVANGLDESCCPHDSDFAAPGPNFRISLPELLRLIQFFNSGGYFYCPLNGTADGFCPGVQP